MWRGTLGGRGWKHRRPLFFSLFPGFCERFVSPAQVSYLCGMETLTEIKRRGEYVHHFVKRNDHVAMYDTTMAGDGGEIIGYEVFLIRVQKPKTISMAGVPIHLKEKELFPSNEMFGSGAYAPHDRKRADHYFDLLTAKMEMGKRGIGLN